MTVPRLVGDRYEIGELLGYGGMAEVHRGRDIRLGRDVAVKVLRADLARDPSFQNRFRREAQAAAGLNHASIVAVYDTGEGIGPEGPMPFIVMEFVEGRTLRDVLRAEGALPPARAMQIVAEVCAALDFSHRAGIVHRDIKPANVMITSAGGVKVMDFGIARALADNSATMTSASAVIGTAQYLSPEQARGESVDARSDVYSTGCLLYELVTGNPPFKGDSPVAVAYQHVRENPQVPSSLNPALPHSVDSIVMKAMAKNPLNRYQTAGEMRTDLQRAIAGQPVDAEQVMTDAQRTELISAPRSSRSVPPVAAYDGYDDGSGRRGAWLWTAAVVVLLLIVGVAAWALLRKDKPAAPVTYAVPSLVGLSPAAAADAIRAAHLSAASGTPDSSNGPCTSGAASAVALVNPTKGNVCTQSPAQGQQVSANTTVTFTIYAGPATVAVPNITGQTFDQAVAALKAVGLNASQTPAEDRSAAGTVLAQDPQAFNQLAPGSVVKLTVSNGMLVMPDVRGKSYQDAHDALNQAGFFNINPPVSAPPQGTYLTGQVQGMNPAQGSKVDPKTTITLTVAAPKVCPTPTPTATPTGTATPTASPSPSVSPTC